MDRNQLAKQIADTAVLHGSFTLRSGRTSSYYIDKYLFLTDPRILTELGAMIAARLPAGTQRLAGAELGGIPLVSAASMAAGLPAIYLRNARKEYGTGKQLEGRVEPDEKIVIVEDVATTGGQVIEAAGVIRAEGGDVIAIIATVDRQEGARENIEGAGYRFESLFTTSDLGLKKGTDPFTGGR
jgi:orotate phosphoribosyltransferase